MDLDFGEINECGGYALGISVTLKDPNNRMQLTIVLEPLPQQATAWSGLASFQTYLPIYKSASPLMSLINSRTISGNGWALQHPQ